MRSLEVVVRGVEETTTSLKGVVCSTLSPCCPALPSAFTLPCLSLPRAARTACAPPASSPYSQRAARAQPVQPAPGPHAACTTRARPAHSPYSPRAPALPHVSAQRLPCALPATRELPVHCPVRALPARPGHCRCCYWPLPLLPCLHALLSAALPCLAAARASLLPPLLLATAAAATGRRHCCPACTRFSALPYPAWPPPALPCCRHCCWPLPLLLLAAATAALLARAAQRFPTLPGRRQSCPAAATAAGHCRCCYWPLPLLPCLHALLSAALPCLATARAALRPPLLPATATAATGRCHCYCRTLPLLPCLHALLSAALLCPSRPRIALRRPLMPLPCPCFIAALPARALPCPACAPAAATYVLPNRAAQSSRPIEQPYWAAPSCCYCQLPLPPLLPPARAPTVATATAPTTAAPAPTVPATAAAVATSALEPLLLTDTADHGHYHCPASAAAECAGVSLAAAALRVGDLGSSGGGAWGTSAGGVEAPGGVEATSLGACDSASTVAEPEEALHSFTLDLGTSRYFFHDNTTVIPLIVSVPVTLADPTGGPVVARGSTTLPCLAVPSGTLIGLHLPSFAKNLVATSVLQDQWVTVTQPGGELVAICTDSRTSEHLATFTRRPGSGVYTLTTESALVAESGQVAALVEVAASCSCRLLTHQTLLWHHHLGHPSLPCLRGMHSRLLVSGLPRSLPPLPRSLVPPRLPCVEGRQRAAPHSSSFPPTTTPVHTFHMDVCCPARVHGQGGERYFLLVVDDYTRYITVFPLQSKAEVRSVLICWIRAIRCQLCARFQHDLLVLRLHSDRGGEFSSSLLEDFCVMEPCVSHLKTSPILRWTGEVGDASPFRVWVALSLVRNPLTGKLSPRTLRNIFLGFPTDAPGLQFYHPGSRRVLSSQDVTFDESVCFYRLHPHRSSPVPLPPLALVSDPPPVAPLPPQGPTPSGVSQVDLSPLVEPVEVFSDTSGPVEGGDLTLAVTVTPRRSARLAVPPGFPPQPSSPPLQPVTVDFGAASGGATGGADFGSAGSGGAECPVGTGGTGGAGACGPGTSRQEALSPERLREWAVQWGSPGGGASRLRAGGTGTARVGCAGTTRSRGFATGGTGVASAASRARKARAGGVGTTNATGGTGDAATVGAAAGRPSGGAGRAGAAGSGGACPGGTSAGIPGGGRAGGTGTGGTRAIGGSGGAGPGGASAGVPGVGRAGDSGTGGTGAAGGTRGAAPLGASAVVPRVGGTGGADTRGASGGTEVGGASRQESLSTWDVRWGSPGGGAGGPGSGGATIQPQQSTLHHLLSLPPVATEFPFAGSTPPLLFPLTVQSLPQLLPCSPLPALAPHTVVTESFTERRDPASRPVTLVHSRRAVRPRPPPVPRTHIMALRPSSVPQRVVLPSPPASSLPHIRDPESHLIRTASLTVTRLLATVVNDPSFESAAASALVAKLVEFAALCRLDYIASLVFYCSYPLSLGGELALGCDGDPDALDIPTPRTYAEAITGPYSSHWQIAMDAEMASWKSTGTYIDEVPPPRANIVDGMWIFRVKWPPGSQPAFKTLYVARGFSQHEGVDFFHNFSPTLKMNTLLVLLHVAAQRDYELHSLDFSIAFLQGSLHEAIWLRCPRGFTGSFPEGTKWSLRRPVYGLRQAPREWHDTLRTTLAALGFAPSSADPSLFLRTDTSLPPFYVIVYVDDLVFATADIETLALVKAELQERHTCTELGELRSYLGLQITRDRARRTITLTQSHMVHTLGMGLVLGGPGLVVLTGRSNASWADDQMTHRSTQGYSFRLGTGSVSWRTKYIALRYFLTRELQQRGQLCLAYVATQANTADVFT
ncbi:unnamed protein product [Closterium sp. NIES-53]